MERASLVVREFVGPDLRPVKHAQNANGITVYQVGRDIGRARNDKLARPSDATVHAVERSYQPTADLSSDPARQG